MPQFPHPTHGLQPAKDLFHPLTLLLADRITGVARCPRVDRTLAPLIVLGHMRCGVQVSRLLHELLDLVSYALSAPTVTRRSPGIASIIFIAADGSALPVAGSTSTSTANPLRFSINTWPLMLSLASLPAPLRASMASGSVVDACVSLDRFSP